MHRPAVNPAGLGLDPVTPTTMSDTDRPGHLRGQAWPGVFSKLGHRMPDHPLTLVLGGPHARDAGLDGYTVYFAFCGAPCWKPTEEAQEYPRCQRCRKALPPRSRDWPPEHPQPSL